MDYEEAYKEALGWMRKIYPTLTGTNKEDAEHYFPELKESKDERIRKEIIEYFTVEWSEEEMRKIVELKYFITQCNGFNKENRKKAFDMIDAFRPRPHWKPSKEQIGALNYAYCELFKRKDVGHNILGPLQKLIDDLQKLR